MWFINLHFIDVQGDNYASHFWIILKAIGVTAADAVPKAGPVVAVPEIQAFPQIPPPDPQVTLPAKQTDSRVPGLRPAWIVALFGLAALVAFALWGMPALAARLAPTPTPTPTATLTSTPTQTLVPSPTFTPLPTIDPVTGTVAASLAWGTEPVEGALVTLCTDWLCTCKGAQFTGLSNADGRFSISGVAPGDYQLITKYPGQKDETRVAGQGGFPISLQVSA